LNARILVENFLFPPEADVSQFLNRLWREEAGQDIAEYAVMVAVILIIVVGTVRLIGNNSNTVFSQVASVVQ
jgi:Flp pilus assembly pilin Flp